MAGLARVVRVVASDLGLPIPVSDNSCDHRGPGKNG
jgi:hypothetical protein